MLLVAARLGGHGLARGLAHYLVWRTVFHFLFASGGWVLVVLVIVLLAIARRSGKL